MITTEQFFEASKKAGMTRPLSWTPSAGAGGGPAQAADVIFNTPPRDVLAGDGRGTDYSVQYPATKLIGLRRGETVTVDGVSYTVREAPYKQLDGTRLEAPLAKI